MDTFDNVNHPSYYCAGRKFQPIDVIQDWDLDFCLGNAVKYISRAGRKTSSEMTNLEKEIQDLNKAKRYLEFKIDWLEKNKGMQLDIEQFNSNNPYQE